MLGFSVAGSASGITLGPAIDVIGNVPLSDFSGNGYGTNSYKDWGNEPSIAVNPVNPNQILISSFAYNAGTSSGADVFYSSNGGTAWSSQFTITRPSASVTIPHDWRFAYDSHGTPHGAVLGSTSSGSNIYVGSSANPTGSGWAWTNGGNAINTINNPASLNNADQPWLALSGSNVYVAYDNFAQAAGVRVASSSNNGLSFIKDTAANTAGINTTFINPGNRIATDGAGNLYDVYTLGASPSPQGVHQVTYFLNRSRDGGSTWDFNGSSGSGGITIASGKSTQLDNAGTQASNTWFAKVNDLRGSIDAVAGDSTGAHVYVMYGLQDVSGADRIYLQEFHPSGGSLTSSPALVISPTGQRAALPSLTVLSNGTVVGEYETYESVNNLVDVHVMDSVDFGASVADDIMEYSFTPLTLLQATGGTSGNREFGDYLFMTSVGNNFYGTFAGRGNVNAGGINTTGLVDPFFFTGTATVPEPRSLLIILTGAVAITLKLRFRRRSAERAVSQWLVEARRASARSRTKHSLPRWALLQSPPLPPKGGTPAHSPALPYSIFCSSTRK
jgi:hypothetical protein